MDFEKHYLEKEGKDRIEKETAAVRQKKAKKIADLNVYNRCMDELTRDVPRLLAMYRKSPPDHYDKIIIEGENLIAWKLSTLDNVEQAYKIYLLPNARLAVFYTKSEWHDSYVDAVNEHGASFKKWVGGCWQTHGNKDSFVGYLELNRLNSINEDVISYVPALESACMGTDSCLKEPERKAKAKKDAEEKAKKALLLAEQREKAVAESRRADKLEQERRAAAEAKRIRKDKLGTVGKIFRGLLEGILVTLNYAPGVCIALVFLIMPISCNYLYWNEDIGTTNLEVFYFMIKAYLLISFAWGYQKGYRCKTKSEYRSVSIRNRFWQY